MTRGSATSYGKVARVVTIALMCLGVVMIYSAGARVGRAPHGFTWFGDVASKQVIFGVAAVVAMSVVSVLDYRWLEYRGDLWRWVGWFVLIAAVVLLVAVYVPGLGLEVNGARRWVRVGPVSFQPSELAKLALAVFLAGVLSHSEYPRERFFRGLLPVCAAVGVVCALVGREDFGTAVLIALTAVGLLIVGSARIWHLIVISLPAMIGFAWLVIRSPYRLRRITAFIDIWADPQDTTYHAIQSLIAITGGSWWGVGLGRGIQKYGYLPEDTTDFIFAIICEELGLPGAVVVMGLIGVLVWCGWQVFRRTESPFGKLLTFAVISTIGLQAVMNIAVATVSVPTKGIALPFVSAGGSGLIISAVAVGLVCSVAKHGAQAAGRERTSVI